jgi:protein-S-isoprenylcysteine O-methyltransferase Ste14
MRRGITANLLVKGDKPKMVRLIERFLRIAALAIVFVQFGSTVFPNAVWAFPVAMPVHFVGIALLFLGNLFFIAALLTMRDNWRAGFDHKQNTSLVTQGIYNISRNPAFAGFDLIYIGCALAFPNIINVALTLVVIIIFHAQILGEEKFLAEKFGNAYYEYKTKVRRYI